MSNTLLMNEKLIDYLQKEDIPTLAAFDAAGLFIKRDETLENFKTRLEKIIARHTEFERELEQNGFVTVFEEYKLDHKSRIPTEIMTEAAEITQKLFSFSINWVPGFFLSHNLSFLWGGCAITDPDEYFTVFLIRKNFAKHQRWFIYCRSELLSHELCHSARMIHDDIPFEEHFAYMTASSRFRKYIGNCFQTKYDALLFIIPVFILLGATIMQTFTAVKFSLAPFWVLALAYPAFLLLRNHFQRRTFFKAKNALTACGCRKPLPVLFRCETEEIEEIASYRKTPETIPEAILQKAEKSLKWQIIKYRFFDCGEVPDIFTDNQEDHKEKIDDTTQGTDLVS